MKNKFLYLNIILFLFSLLTGCGIPLTPGDFDTNEMVPFSDDQKDFVISYPSSWTARTFPDGYRGDREVTALIYAPSVTSSAIYIARKTLDTPTLEEAANWGKKRISDDFEQVEIGVARPKILANGIEVFERISYSNPNSSSSVRLTDIYIVQGDEAIMIQFSVKENLYDEVADTFDAIIDSCEIYPGDGEGTAVQGLLKE